MPNLSPVKDKLKSTLPIYFWVLCWWNSVLEGVYSQGLSVGYGSNDNKLRIGERVEWVICPSDRQYLHERLLPAIINFLVLSDECSYHHLHQKNLDIQFWQIYQYLKSCSPPVLRCSTSVVLHYLALQHHLCIVTCAALRKHCL